MRGKLKDYRDELEKRSAREMMALKVEEREVPQIITSRLFEKKGEVSSYYRREEEKVSFRDVYIVRAKSEKTQVETENYFLRLAEAAKAYYETSSEQPLYVMDGTDTYIDGFNMPSLFKIRFEDIRPSYGLAFVLNEDLKGFSVIRTEDKLQNVYFTNILDAKEEYWYDGTLYIPTLSTVHHYVKYRRHFTEIGDDAYDIGLYNRRMLIKGEAVEPDFLGMEDPKELAESIKIANDKLSKGVLHCCKDCGKFFFLSKDEQEWYRSKGFSVPKRCFSCRMERKREKEDI